MKQTYTGSCHCGAVRYRVAGALEDVAHCHCSVCRRVTGGLLVTWATVRCDDFQWLQGTPQRYDSSASCVRYFCSRCGAHTQKMLLQTYKRDTGEIMHDLSVPIYLQGTHWGGFRMGYKAH